jgi:transposase-like protein
MSPRLKTTKQTLATSPEALQDWLAGLLLNGRTVTQVARDLGCSIWSLGRWVERHQAGQKQSQPQTVATETPEQRELRRLRQENDYLRRQRDILKKALSIVSSEHPEGGLR